MTMTPEKKQVVICGACDKSYDTYSQEIMCPHKELPKDQKARPFDKAQGKPDREEQIAEELYYQHKGEFLEEHYRKENKWFSEETGFKREFYIRAKKIIALLPDETEIEYKQAFEADVSGLWRVTNAIKKEIESRSWILEGRGCYEWDDNRYKDETRLAFEAVLELIANVQHPAQQRFIAVKNMDTEGRDYGQQSIYND